MCTEGLHWSCGALPTDVASPTASRKNSEDPRMLELAPPAELTVRVSSEARKARSLDHAKSSANPEWKAREHSRTRNGCQGDKAEGQKTSNGCLSILEEASR